MFKFLVIASNNEVFYLNKISSFSLYLFATYSMIVMINGKRLTPKPINKVFLGKKMIWASKFVLGKEFSY